MLHRVKDLEGMKLGAQDGEIGHVKELYFEDTRWTVRYLVADTGKWLPGRQVLVSPFAIKGVDLKDNHVDVNLTVKKVEEGPSITEDMPVSRQYEMEYHQYYGWPMYWYGPALWGPAPFPVYGHEGGAAHPNPPRLEEQGDPNLRSTRGVTGYHLHAQDGEIGHVEDFIVDDSNWAIRYLVVDTKNWWPGKRVLLSTEWIHDISWDRSLVSVDLTKDVIKGAPEFDPRQLINRQYEGRLYSYYKQEGYWDREQLKADMAHHS